MEIWSKTILSVYRYLDNIANAIDNLVRKKCINSSFYLSGRNADAYACTSKIIALTERKVQLINLKVITEQALMQLTPTERKILTLFYIDGVSSKDIANLLEISIRSFFRKKAQAVENFDRKLKFNGYTDAKLNDMFRGEHWLNTIYLRAKNCEQEGTELPMFDKINENRFMKQVMHEFNSIGTYYYNYV